MQKVPSRHLDEAFQTIIAHFLLRACCGASGILIITRSVDDAPGDWIQPDILTNDESVALLLKWTKRPEDDDAPYRAICDLAGHLPLAFRLAGRYMQHHRLSAESYLAWLRQTPLDALDQGHRQQDSVPLLMTRSLEQATEKAHQAMAIAGLLALAPFERAALATALETTENGLRRPLGELLNLGLLLPDGDDRVQVAHALVRTYARERLHPAEGALDGLAAHYQALVEEQNALGAAGHARLDLDRPHLMAMLRRLSERQAWSLLFALADPVEDYLDLSGRSTERIEACKLAFAGARESGDQREEGRWLNTLAGAHIPVGRLPDAIKYYEEALAIHRDIGHRSGEGYSLNGLGNAYNRLGRYDEAADYYERALTIAREIGDRRSEASWLGNLGNANYSLGRYDEAIDYHQQSLAISRDIGDRRNEGAQLGNLGNAYYSLGRYDEAIDYHQQALAISREIGDRRNEGANLGNLGLAYSALGRYDEAIDYMEQAIHVFEEIKSPAADQARRLLEEMRSRS